ncbi:MAG TPA: branched-chain amino acid ABC transporter permease, partial [Ktedonobacteraceae bacterium]
TLKKGADAIAAGSAGLIAVLATRLPFNSGLLVATFIGITLGLLVEAKGKKTVISAPQAERLQSQQNADPEIAEDVPRSYPKEEGQQ